MICIQDCTRAKCLQLPDACTEEQILHVGTLDSGVVYAVYIKDNNTDAIRSFEITADGDGMVSLNLSEIADWINPVNSYTLWIAGFGEDMYTTRSITIGEDMVNCLILQFERVFVDDVVTGLGLQTVQL